MTIPRAARKGSIYAGRRLLMMNEFGPACKRVNNVDVSQISEQSHNIVCLSGCEWYTINVGYST
ncbi:unnamed protein product [marine sediment metagenome]|uniref:Uncharacterized protein n=1 Tax=marine sediment metagenome TaxID=412755 RepID=X1CIC1_9ZZZZ